MAVNHPGTPEERAVARGHERIDRVCVLTNRRDRFAAAHAAYEAHGFSDAALFMHRQVRAVEQELEALAPRIYRRLWTEWVARDAALMHTPERPNPECALCRLADSRQLRHAS